MTPNIHLIVQRRNVGVTLDPPLPHYPILSLTSSIGTASQFVFQPIPIQSLLPPQLPRLGCHPPTCGSASQPMSATDLTLSSP